MLDIKDDFDQQRQMYSVLVLHFIEGVKQSEIAERLNLSHTKVNRMIAAGRKAGLISGLWPLKTRSPAGLALDNPSLRQRYRIIRKQPCKWSGGWPQTICWKRSATAM